MAIVLTSFLPAGGPTTGGTRVVIVGTGLDTVDEASFGTTPAAIDTTATNTATSLTLIAPPIDPASTLARTITLVDNAGAGAVAVSAGLFTYTVVTSPVLTSSGAGKWKLEIDSSVGQDGSSFIPVRGVTEFSPSVATTSQDDTDYDSGIWGSDAKTLLKWSASVKLSRKRAAGYVEDAGQKLLRLAGGQVGSAGTVLIRWYDRNGHGSEAHQGYALAEWSDDGGAVSALSTVSCTLTGQGARQNIVNPAGA